MHFLRQGPRAKANVSNRAKKRKREEKEGGRVSGGGHTNYFRAGFGLIFYCSFVLGGCCGSLLTCRSAPLSQRGTRCHFYVLSLARGLRLRLWPGDWVWDWRRDWRRDCERDCRGRVGYILSRLHVLPLALPDQFDFSVRASLRASNDFIT